MKIADILPEVTVLPLRRFADAWDVKTIKSEKRDVFEQAILSEVSRIDSDEAVRQRLRAFEHDVDYVRHGHAERMLRLLLDEPGYSVAEQGDLIKRMVETDAAFHAYALAPNATRHIEQRSLDIYQSVIQVAWENKVSFDEYQLIKRLQRHFNINRRDHRVIEIRSVNAAPITQQEADQALRDLGSYGFVCQFRIRGNTHVVIPEEIALRLRSAFGIVLQSGAYRQLASRLSYSQLKQALEQAGQPSVSNKKDFLMERLIDGDVTPAGALDPCDNDILDGILADLSSQKPPSMRAVKIRHIIAYFDRFATKPVENGDDDPDRTYYAYLVELASRQYEVLRAGGVIQHDQNVDRAFERGVRYAFSKLLGHPAIQFTGNAHADGGVAAAKGRMVLWDCKSALHPYALTEPKSAQFLHYIAKESPNIVSPFLIISCDFTGDSNARALALKANCPPGTEIALLRASDLKRLAERWVKDHPDKQIPLDVLAHPGLLSMDILETRLKLFEAQAQARGATP